MPPLSSYAGPAIASVGQRVPSAPPGGYASQGFKASPAGSAGRGEAPPVGVQIDRAERFGHRLERLGPSGGEPIQRARQVDTRYNKIDYRKSSKFRFARYRRRVVTGFTTKDKAGINFLTVKYKKGNKPFYLTTRSVPQTNKKNVKLPPGHSEQRYAHLKKKFEKKHKLKHEHIEWAATEREPCGHGPGMANCRGTLSKLKIPDNKIYFGSDYPDREDVRKAKKDKSSDLNKEASALRKEAGDDFTQSVQWIGGDHDSEAPSEDDNDVVDEYESDYDEKEAPRRKRKIKALEGSFRHPKPNAQKKLRTILGKAQKKKK